MTSNTHWWRPEARGWNSWSNVAYPLVGWGLAVLLGWHQHAITFAVSMTTLGVGSGVYHWVGGSTTRPLDWAGMYAVFVALVMVGTAPYQQPGTTLFIVAAIAVLSGAIVAAGLVGADAMLGVGLVLSLLPPALHGGTAAGLAGVSLLLFLVAKVFHSADNRREGWVGRYGHAWWHAWTALAFDAAFLATYTRVAL